MAKLAIKPGSENVSLLLFIQDSTSTVGAGKTGLAYNTASLTCYGVRPGEAAAAISLVTQTVAGAWSSGGFVEIDATNMPGVYRFDVPNARLAAGVRSSVIMLKGASGMAPLMLEVDLNAEVNLVSILGTALTETAGQIAAAFTKFFNKATPTGTINSLPDAVAGAANGVAIVGSVMGKSPATLAAADVSGNIPVDLQTIKTQTVTAAAGVTFPASIGTGTSTYAGADTAGTTTLLSRVLGTLAAGTHNPQSGDGFARLGAPAGASVSADIADLPTNSELATALGAADDATLAAIAALNNLSSAQAQSAAAAAIAAYDPPTNTELEARTLLAASYATAAALAAVDDYVDTEVSAIRAVTDKIDTAMVLDGAVYQFTANALELAPAGGGGTGLTAQETADAVNNLAPTGAGGAVGSIRAQFVTVARTGEDGDTLKTLSDQIDERAKPGDPMTIAHR